MDVKEELKELWKTAFQDTDYYIGLFFDRVYKEENAVYIREGNRIVSALHLVPYTFVYKGGTTPLNYICGVATLPDEQGKGFMRSLMEKAEDVIRRREIPLAALIPAEKWLFDVYRKMGYTTFFNYSLHTYQPDGQTPLSPSYNLLSYRDYSKETLYHFFEEFYRKRNNYLDHTLPDFELIMDELIASGNELIILSHSNETVGMAFIDTGIDGTNLHIREFLFRNGNDQQMLLRLLSVHYDVNGISYRLPPETGNSHPYGMIRVILPQHLPVHFPEEGYMNLMLD